MQACVCLCVCVVAGRWAAPGHINSSSTGSVCAFVCVSMCLCCSVSFSLFMCIHQCVCVCVHVHITPPFTLLACLQWPLRTPHTIFSLGCVLPTQCVCMCVSFMEASLLLQLLFSTRTHPPHYLTRSLCRPGGIKRYLSSTVPFTGRAAAYTSSLCGR